MPRKTSSARARTHRDSAPRRTEVLVLGGRERTRAVVKALGKLRIVLLQEPTLAEVKGRLSNATAAIVLVPPLPHTETLATVQELRAHRDGGRVPVFVIVPDGFSDWHARRLYKAGATAVFEWPYEGLLVPQMIAQLSGALPKKGNKRGDAALARALSARLELTELADDDIAATVIAGSAVISGKVDGYWKKQRLEHLLGHVPGVLAVFTDDVVVATTPRSDAALVRHIRGLLRSVSESAPKTISVASSDGRVALAGAVSTHAELERIIGLVGHIQGVRSIENLVTVSPTQTLKARGLAARLRRGIGTLWPDANVNVTVFGHVAVLAGTVRPLADKWDIERFALAAPGIGRVVNKLVVTPQ